MSWEIALAHCASLRATIDATRVSLELVSAQLAGFEALVKAKAAPTAREELPAHCSGTPGSQCALRSEDARIEKASLTHPKAWICTGCRVYSENGITTT